MDFIELLHLAGNLRGLLLLHDQGSDVKTYFKCASGDIGDKLEERIKLRYASLGALSNQIRQYDRDIAADALAKFTEDVHLFICKDDSETEARRERVSEFLRNNVITIKDH